MFYLIITKICILHILFLNSSNKLKRSNIQFLLIQIIVSNNFFKDEKQTRQQKCYSQDAEDTTDRTFELRECF